MSDRDKKLTINEIYVSIQGESTWAGLPCVFVRLTFCDLRCTYCDTEYAFYEGKKQTLGEIVDEVLPLRLPAGRDHRRRAAAAKECAAADDAALRRRPHRADRDERRARYFGSRSARASDHGSEDAWAAASRAQLLFQHRAPDAARRSEIRHRLARRLRMVARAGCASIDSRSAAARCSSRRSSAGSIRARSWSGSWRTNCPCASSSRCTSSSGRRRSAGFSGKIRPRITRNFADLLKQTNL